MTAAVRIAVKAPSNPTPDRISWVLNSVFSVTYFKKSKSPESLMNRLTTKKNSGIPAPKIREFLDVLKMQEAQKQIPLTTKW